MKRGVLLAQGPPHLTLSWFLCVDFTESEYYFIGILLSLCNFSLHANQTTPTFGVTGTHWSYIIARNIFHRNYDTVMKHD